MQNKEFSPAFSSAFFRHLIRTSAGTAPEAAEPEEKEIREALFYLKPSIKPAVLSAPTMIPSISTPTLIPAKREELSVPIPSTRISDEERSLRGEIQRAKEEVFRRIMPTPTPAVKMLPTLIPSIITTPQKVPIKEPELKIIKPEVQEAEDYFGRIDYYVKDPTITSIECSGTDSIITMKKGNQLIDTKITLSSQEIEDIIKKFSRLARTEITPIFKVSFKDLMLNAFVSPIIGTRFLITRTGK
jgi:hypothetical protein